VSTFGAFFDANVLYPSGLRNLLMHLALTGVFRADWSADVHKEWMGNLLMTGPTWHLINCNAQGSLWAGLSRTHS
jgi:hypothetical protein